MSEISSALIYKQAVIKEKLKQNPDTELEFMQNVIDNCESSEDILMAIRTVASARGFKKFAEDADLNRENLYRVLSPNGNPRLDTFLRVLDLLGFKLSLKRK